MVNLLTTVVLAFSMSADAFAAALLHLADDSELRRKMGEAARRYAIVHLNRDKILLAIEHVFEQICRIDSQSNQNGLAAKCTGTLN